MSRKAPGKLTAKQKRFCDEYLIDLNGTQAAIRAGYSKNSANEQAAQLLAKLSVSAYISERREKLSQKLEITQERVLEELARIGFSNVKDFVNGGNNVLELKHIEDSKTAAVAAVKTRLGDDGSVNTEIKLHDKVSALEKLARHLGLFEKDNIQQRPEALSLKVEIVPPNDDNE